MPKIDRRGALKQIALGTASFSIPACRGMRLGDQYDKTPNFILLMADDMGFGDTGYNGHPHIETPTLDKMAQTGVVFGRFYSAAPLCSPTRASCLTGRHPSRQGIFWANEGHLKKEEVILAEALKTEGYATGHFGKWHLGTLTKTEPDSNRGGPENAAHYSPPWVNGFDESFSTEARTATWDPLLEPVNKPKESKTTSFKGNTYNVWWDPIKEGEVTQPSRTHRKRIQATAVW